MDLCAQRFPVGIHITEADAPSAPGMEGISVCDATSLPHSPHNTGNGQAPHNAPWGYLYLHNKRVELFKQQVDAYNLAHPDSPHRCFVHYSYKYQPKNNGRGVAKTKLPSISGLVFLQGNPSDLQAFLRENHPQYHLVNDCSTGKSASIADSVMQPFIEAATLKPENITFLREPFIKFAQAHTKLRILSGPFRGLEGYIIRINRDRQLVMNFGGYAVAIRGVHNEDFEVAE